MDNKNLTVADIDMILKQQKSFFDSQATKSLEFRIKQLKKLKSALKKHESEIFDALFIDLGKHENEAFATEVGFEYNSINEAIKGIHRWARPERRRTSLIAMPSSSKIIKEPYGAVLIMGPFNYPFQLLIEPLIGAIAAGNTAVLKPSIMAPNVSAIVKKITEETFDANYIACIEGGRDANAALLNAKFDYIFFTGSVAVGKVVMKAAAENLIPVTLELGGKSPVIVDKTADIKQAARRIVWGKTLNAGQTCIAPDYLLVHEKVKDALIDALKLTFISFFGEDMEKSTYLGRIINDKHFTRLSNMLDADHEHIIFGGNTNREKRFIQPTLIDLQTETAYDAASMGEEIFGPILPIITYSNLDEAIASIRRLPKPLALYLFTKDKTVLRHVLSQVSSGNACINDTISHVINANLPFGGVGEAGMGAYHGRESFNTFSHKKGVLSKPAGFNIELAYPPYTQKQMSLLRKFFK